MAAALLLLLLLLLLLIIITECNAHDTLAGNSRWKRELQQNLR